MAYSSRLSLHVDGLAEVGRLLLPRVIGQAAFQVNFIVVTSFASREGPAETSALSYAWQLLMFPHGVLALSISTVIFPTMARLFEQGRTDEMRATLSRALRPLLFLTLPASVGLFAFRTPIVGALFQWGAFSERSTELTAEALAFFAVGLTAYAVVEVQTRAFYAMHDTRTPVAAGIAIMLVNVALCALLVGPLSHAGLALALSVSTVIEMGILAVVLRDRIGPLDLHFLGWLARVLVATLTMAVAAFATVTPLVAATRPGAASRPLQIALLIYTVVMVGAVYAVAAFYLRVPELDRAFERVGARFPRLARLVASLR
jgi:putative peptidoglycan lipid II flippase